MGISENSTAHATGFEVIKERPELGVKLARVVLRYAGPIIDQITAKSQQPHIVERNYKDSVERFTDNRSWPEKPTFSGWFSGLAGVGRFEPRLYVAVPIDDDRPIDVAAMTWAAPAKDHGGFDLAKVRIYDSYEKLAKYLRPIMREFITDYAQMSGLPAGSCRILPDDIELWRPLPIDPDFGSRPN